MWRCSRSASRRPCSHILFRRARTASEPFAIQLDSHCRRHISDKPPPSLQDILQRATDSNRSQQSARPAASKSARPPDGWKRDSAPSRFGGYQRPQSNTTTPNNSSPSSRDGDSSGSPRTPGSSGSFSRSNELFSRINRTSGSYPSSGSDRPKSSGFSQPSKFSSQQPSRFDGTPKPEWTARSDGASKFTGQSKFDRTGSSGSNKFDRAGASSKFSRSPMDSIRPTDQRSTEGSSGSRFGRPAAGGSFKGGSKAGAEASDANFYDENAAIDDASDFDDGVDDRGKQQRHKKGKGRIEVQVDSPNLKPKKGKPTQGARRQQDNDDDFDDDDEFMERKKKKKEQQKPKEIQVPEAITVANLASLVGISVGHLSKKMKNLGFDAVTPDLLLNQEMAGLVAQELNVIPVMLTTTAVDLEPRPEPESWSEFPLRAPIVTIMGHVDHGKTTLLDSLRKTSVAAGEAGGITQHIGAFSVTLPSMKHITFLDTPGHAAFTAMRRRGAKTTDIVVLVVAADDGIMPQTVEAIKHAKEAGAPIIVAINKCDKPQANPSKVKEELTRYEVVVEDYGGDVPAVEVSGLTGQGLDNLEETILAVAEMMDIRGDASGLPEAFVIESHVAMGLGNVATVLVRRGTLRPGDVIVAGTTWGKVRSMTDEHGRQVKEAGPSIPVRINGWKGLPSAGDQVIGAESEALAKDVVETRITRLERQKQLESIDKINVQREQQRRALERSKAETGGETEPETPEFVKPTVNIILKADVDGSLEAITDALAGFPSHEIELKIVGSGVGNISESDIDLAEVAKASIITFNLPASRSMQSMAESRAIPIHGFKIIYELLDHVKDTLLERLPPDVAFEVKSEADVLQLFKINTKKNQFETIAGSRITTGKLEKECAVRVVRAGTTLFEGKIKTLKHHKKDITEANKGMECGIAIEGFEDLQVGDVIQSFVRIETRRKSL